MSWGAGRRPLKTGREHCWKKNQDLLLQRFQKPCLKYVFKISSCQFSHLWCIICKSTYCAISINLAGPVTHDSPAEILVSARCQNGCDSMFFSAHREDFEDFCGIYVEILIIHWTASEYLMQKYKVWVEHLEHDKCHNLNYASQGTKWLGQMAGDINWWLQIPCTLELILFKSRKTCFRLLREFVSIFTRFFQWFRQLTKIAVTSVTFWHLEMTMTHDCWIDRNGTVWCPFQKWVFGSIWDASTGWEELRSSYLPVVQSLYQIWWYGL